METIKHTFLVWYEDHGYEPELRANCLSQDAAIGFINQQEWPDGDDSLSVDDFEITTDRRLVFNLGDAEWVIAVSVITR